MIFYPLKCSHSRGQLPIHRCFLDDSTSQGVKSPRRQSEQTPLRVPAESSTPAVADVLSWMSPKTDGFSQGKRESIIFDGNIWILRYDIYNFTFTNIWIGGSTPHSPMAAELVELSLLMKSPRHLKQVLNGRICCSKRSIQTLGKKNTLHPAVDMAFHAPSLS